MLNMMHVRERGDRVSTVVCATKRDEPGRKRFPCGEVVVGSRRRMRECPSLSLSVCRLRTRTRQGALRGVCRAIWLILPVVICLSQRLSHACLWIRPWRDRVVFTLLMTSRCKGRRPSSRSTNNPGTSVLSS